LNLVAGLSIFTVTLVFIIRGKPHRSIVAMLGAVAMVLAGTYMGFYSQGEAIQAVDWNTLGLLLGMMIIVAILRETGLFRFLAVWGARASGGDPWRLLIMLGLITAFTSMIIDNVTTILLMAPVAILVCDILGIEPVPFMLFQTFLSNVGGIATLVGDPPNIMIGSAAGLDFNSFILHLMPIALITIFFVLFIPRILFPRIFKIKDRHLQKVMEMIPGKSITDPRSLKIGLFCLIGVVGLFTLEAWLHLKPAFVALIGAVVILTLTGFSPGKVLESIDWSTLIFFAALFVMVGGLEKSGFIQILGKQLSLLAHENLLTSSLFLMWVSALICTVVNRVPYTAAMIPLISHISATGVNAEPLWWSLALGVGLGGNATPIGTTAGIAMIAHPISFKMWFRSGMLVTLLTTFLASVFVAVFFAWYN